jgi:hypothetical protein
MLAPGIEFDIDQVELAVAHPALGDQGIGKAAHGGGRSAQDHAFEAVLVIQVGMQGGHRQVVLTVLQGREAFRQVAFVVVIDVGQAGHAMAGLAALPARLFEMRPQHVAHRLGAVLVATFGDQAVEFRGQVRHRGKS